MKDQDIFAKAWMLIDWLALWRKPPMAKEALFQLYRPANRVDTANRESLTTAMCDVLWYFWENGYLKKLSKQQFLSDYAHRLTHLMRRFDWLDTQRLRDVLFALVTDTGPNQ